jgi:hypothetical protein
MRLHSTHIGSSNGSSSSSRRRRRRKTKKKKCREIPIREVFDLLASRVMGLVFRGKKER